MSTKTVSLNLSAYSHVLIVFRVHSNSNYTYSKYLTTEIAQIGSKHLRTTHGNTGIYLSGRGNTVSTKQVSFGQGFYAAASQYNTTSTTTSDYDCVPIKIYGIKKA